MPSPPKNQPPRVPVKRKQSLAEKIKTLRTERGLSITALAEISQVTLSSVSAIESGSRPNPGADTLIALASGLRVSLDDLLGFDVNSLPPEPVRPTTIEGLAVALEALAARVAALEAGDSGNG